MTDREKFLTQARTYIGKNGDYVCKTKLKLGAVYDWCAFVATLIMQDCGFIGKYVKAIDGGAGNIPRYSDGVYGTWFAKGSKAPQPGDLIFFKYDGCPTQDKYSCSHIGIVEAVAGNAITTLEGNVDGYGSDWASTSTFKRKTRYLSDGSVHSFFRPYWEGAKPQPAPSIIYRVQVGAYSKKENAELEVQKLKKAGFNDCIIVEVKK